MRLNRVSRFLYVAELLKLADYNRLGAEKNEPNSYTNN